MVVQVNLQTWAARRRASGYSLSFQRPHGLVISPLAVGERIIALLDEGLFTATYKYGVLLGLLDLCLELGADVGGGTLTVTTRQLAGKVLGVYWPQVRPLPLLDGAIPRQNSRGSRDARIVRLIDAYKTQTQREWSGPSEAKLRDPTGFERLLLETERVLIEMPLPRLQSIGNETEQFLYEINWSTAVNRNVVSRYLRGESSDFDNRIVLRAGVAAALIQLNGLLRPLIQRSWALKVARLNRLEAGVLHDFLFGQERIALVRVSASLAELQEGRCFYCEGRLGPRPTVDHFVPWARVPNNNIENLVVTHEACNGAKSDFLPALAHVRRWGRRLDIRESEHRLLADISVRLQWPSDCAATRGTACTIYGRLPPTAKLWVLGKEFEERGRESLSL